MLNTGAVDIGQGSDTVLVQIAAQSLGLAPDQINLAAPDTDASPYNWSTSASRVTYMVGRAVIGAVDEAVGKLKKYAGDMMECSEEDLEIRPGGFIGIKGVPDRLLPFGAISGYAHWAAGGPIIGTHALHFDGPHSIPKKRPSNTSRSALAHGLSPLKPSRSSSTRRPAVSMYSRCGPAHDIGKAINPKAVEGQIEGGVVQGLGYALFEEMEWDSGRIANPSLMDYKIPGPMESPRQFIRSSWRTRQHWPVRGQGDR